MSAEALCAALLALDPDRAEGVTDQPATTAAIVAAIGAAAALLPLLDLDTSTALAGLLRDNPAPTRFSGYLALLVHAWPNPLGGARAIHALGRGLFQGGQAPNEVLPLFELARLCYLACPEPPLRDIGRLLAGLAGVLYSNEGWDEPSEARAATALELAREATALLDQTGTPEERAATWALLSDVALYNDDELTFDASATALALTDDSPEGGLTRAELWCGLAHAHHMLHDDLVAADELLERSREGMLGHPDPLYLASYHLTAGLLRLDQGDFHRATLYLDAAEQLFTVIKNYENLALLTFHRARLQLALGEPALARATLLKARAGFAAHRNQKEDAEALLLLAQLDSSLEEGLAAADEAATTFARRGNRHAHALAQLERARVALRPRRPRNAVERERQAVARLAALDTLAPLADTFASLGRPRYALLTQIEHALAELAEPATLAGLAEEATALGDPLARLRLNQALGQTYERAGQPAQASQAYVAAIDDLRAARAHIRINAHAARFLEQRRLPYQRAFALALATGDLAAAWAHADEPCAAALLDQLQNPADFASVVPNDPRWQKVQQIRERLNLTYAAQTPESHSGAFRTHRLAPAPSAAIRQLEQELSAALDSLRTAGDQRAAWELGATRTPGELQALLGSRTALVSFVSVGRAEAPATRDLYALVLTAEGLRVAAGGRPIADAGQLDTLDSRQARARFEQPQPDYRPFLRALHRTLIAPLAELIADCERLIFVLPDDDPRLRDLPLHAALDGERYLVERYIVSYAPSASAFWLAQQRPAPPMRKALAAGYGPDLQYVEREIALVARLAGGQSLQGPFEATELLVQLSTANLVHLSCHAAPNPGTDSRLAYLAIGPSARLYAHDLFGAHLQADLVALSACETGREDRVGLGLVGGCLAAGARSVLATLWKADDRAAHALVGHFYAALFANPPLDRAAALTVAQRTLIATPDLDHPAFWAPFFLAGAIGPLALVL